MITFILDSVKEMLGIVTGGIPKILGVVGILVIGVIAGRVISQLLTRVLKELHLDKISHQLGIEDILHKGGLKYTFSEMLGKLVYWIIMLMVFILTLKTVGLVTVDEGLHRIMSYLPNVFSGVFVMIVGLLLAKVVTVIIGIVAYNTHLPKPELLTTLSTWVIILFTLTLFLQEVGLSILLEGTTFYMLFGGLCLALAISFGLAGKDTAAKYLGKIVK